MTKKIVAIPLSVATAIAIGYAGISGTSGSLTLSINPNEWIIVGSDRGINIESLIGTYKADGTGCANPGALVSAWQYDAQLGKWKTTACTYDPTSMGYELVTSTGGYEGVWLHAGTTGGSGITVNEALAAAAPTITVRPGWNLVSTGSEGVTFSGIGVKPTTNYEILKDVNNEVKVYAFQNNVWRVWSPNQLTETPANVATGLSPYEGFWVKVKAQKTYQMVPNSSSTGSGTFDGGTGAPVGSPEEGTEQTIQKDLTPEEAAETLFLFPSTARFLNHTAANIDSNASRAAIDLVQKVKVVAQEGNSTGATSYDYNLSSAITRWTELNTTSTGVATTHTTPGIFQFMYNLVSPNGYIPTTIKGYAATAYTLIKDLNASYNKLNSVPGVTYYLQDLYTKTVDYNVTVGGLYNDWANFENNNSGKSLSMSKLNSVKATYDLLKAQLSQAETAAKNIKIAAANLYQALLDENTSQGGKQVSYVVTQVPNGVTAEQNKTYTFSFPAGFYNDYGGDISTIPSAKLTLTVNGNNYNLTIDGTDDNLSDFNGTSSSYIQDFNSTIAGNSTFSQYVYVSGNAMGSNGWELNISGKPGAGDFGLTLSFLDDGNTTYYNNIVNKVADWDYNKTVTKEYVPAQPATPQIGTISFPATAKYKAGDEFNITFGSVGNGQDNLATIVWNDSVTTTSSNFFEQNISFKISDADIGSSDSQTRQNIAAKIASQINQKESNLTASASGEIVTVQTKQRTDNNSTLYAAKYEMKIYVNGINYDDMINTAKYVKMAADALENNMSKYVSGEGSSIGKNIKSLDINYSNAYNSMYAVSLGGTTTNATVYKDNLTKLYWNATGVASPSACSTTFAGGKVGWRLPTLMEALSLFDSSGAISSELANMSGNVVLKSGKYILADHNATHGWRVNLTTLSAPTLVQKSSSGASITCVADYYANGDSSYKFNDFYYFIDPAGVTSRFSSNIAQGLVVDKVMNISWQRRPGAGAFPTGWTTDGKTTSSEQANTYCAQLNMRLPSQDELRSLNLYFLKAYYANNKSGNSLSAFFPYDFSLTSGAYWYKDGSNYGVLNPTADVSKENMFNQTAAGGTGYKVICVKDN